MFKKLRQLITPPPFRRTPRPKRVPVYVDQASLPSILKPLLKQLTTAHSTQDAKARQALSEIKELALQKGLYVTAFEIKALLETMPTVDAKGRRHHKPRGYVLAGDFFLAHIQREIGAIKSESYPIGPRIFRSYCNEMIACLLEGENVRRAIETPVLLIDELFSNAIDDFGKSGTYLEMAAQVSASARELTKQYFERQAGRTAPRADSEAGHRFPTPPPTDPFTTLDKAAIGYSDEIEGKVVQIRDRLLEYKAELEPKESEVGGVFAGVAARPEYLLALLQIVDAAKYLPFLAFLKERIASLVQEDQAENARHLLHNAAEDYENQGDRENRLFFSKLSRKRYEKAHDLFLRANDTERAAEVQSRISNQ